MWKLLILNLLFVTQASASVKAYFNHSEASRYTDPYRNITRSGDNLEAVIIGQILSAKKSIYVAVQELRLPLIAAALIRKKNEGVDVRVVLENDYNFDVTSQRETNENGEHEASRLTELMAFVDANRNRRFEKEELENRDAIYMLKNAKIPLIDDTSDLSRGSGLMHHKFIVVDGRSTVVSSANFTMSCIHGDVLAPESLGNANSMIVVDSVDFARIFTVEFSQLWGDGRRGNFGRNKAYRGPQTVNVRGFQLTVQFSPTSQRLNWQDSVSGLMASHLAKAKRSIKAALFVFSEQNLANVMEQRQKVGVEIGVLIEPKFAYRDYSELLDMMGLEIPSQRCAVEPDNNPWMIPAREVGMARLRRGDVLHHKFAVVDNRAVIMGSQNWSDAANVINDETLVVIEGRGISDLYTQEYDRLKRTALLGPTEALLSHIYQVGRYCAENGFL